jgi:hypothetical protein
MNEVTVTKRGADRVRGGHLWIYSSDVANTDDAEGGSIVTVRDQNRNLVGQALFSDSSQIALRFLTQSDAPIDREWWRQRIVEAANRRAHLAPHTNAYRLVYSEGDLLPSIIIDRYHDVLVLQTLSQGSEKVKPLLVEILAEQFKPRAIIERNDVRVRQYEGLEMIVDTLYGEAPGEFEINQDGVRFLVSPLSGQKTGSFLDQRENRLAARAVGHGRALDCFTFAGSPGGIRKLQLAFLRIRQRRTSLRARAAPAGRCRATLSARERRRAAPRWKHARGDHFLAQPQFHKIQFFIELRRSQLRRSVSAHKTAKRFEHAIIDRIITGFSIFAILHPLNFVRLQTGNYSGGKLTRKLKGGFDDAVSKRRERIRLDVDIGSDATAAIENAARRSLHRRTVWRMWSRWCWRRRRFAIFR